MSKFLKSIMARAVEIFFYLAELQANSAETKPLFISLNTQLLSVQMKDKIVQLFCGKFPSFVQLQGSYFRNSIPDLRDFIRHLKSTEIRLSLMHHQLSTAKLEEELS